MAPVYTGFLLLIYWKARRLFLNLSIIRIVQTISEKHLRTCAFTAFILYGSVSTFAGFARHAAIETRAFDLGIFAQAVWNTLHGHFLFSSLKENICLLGDHISPILVLIAPVYALWQDPRTLLIIQAFSMAACLLFITKIACRHTQDKFIAFCFLLIYFFLISPRSTLREDFHPEVLAEPLLMLAFLSLERGKIFLFIFASLIAAAAKENIWGIIFMLAFYSALIKKHRLPGIILMIISPAIFLLSVKTLIPHLSGKPYLYEGFYLHLFKNPDALLTILKSGETWEYILKIFSPFSFLSFLSPSTLFLTFPILIQNLLSNNPVFRSLNYHYTTGLIPFAAISAIYGFQNLSKVLHFDQSKRRVFASLILMLSIILSGHSEYYFIWQSRSHINDHKTMILSKLRNIGSDLTVLTHNNFAAQLANRKHLYQFEYNDQPTKNESALTRKADLVVFDESFWEPGTLSAVKTLEDLTSSGYKIDFNQDGFYILRKNPS